MPKTTLLPVILLAALALGGCASVPVTSLARPSMDAGGEVLVYRESAFAAGRVGLTVGVSGSAFAILGNSEKVRVMLPAGEHEIFVQARSADPSKARVTVQKGGTVCLRTSSNSDAYLKALIPITLAVTGFHFYLDKVPCPPEEELAKYKDIAVTYR